MRPATAQDFTVLAHRWGSLAIEDIERHRYLRRVVRQLPSPDPDEVSKYWRRDLIKAAENAQYAARRAAHFALKSREEQS